MKRLLVPLVIALVAAGCAEEAQKTATPVDTDRDSAEKSAGVPVAGFGDGVVTRTVQGGVDDAVTRLERAIEAKGFTIVAKLDHQANAEKAGLEMNPATVIIFGNPSAGTPLMKEGPTAALDLPQRMAVFQNAQGEGVVAYNDPVYLATRHNITGQQERLDEMAQALSALAEAAAGEPVEATGSPAKPAAKEEAQD